jgi:hypothetical protein
VEILVLIFWLVGVALRRVVGGEKSIVFTMLEMLLRQTPEEVAEISAAVTTRVSSQALMG